MMEKKLKEIRAKYNIPEQYTAYIQNSEYIFEQVERKKKADVEYSQFHFNSHELQGTSNFGCIKGEYYVAVKLYCVEQERWDINIFTDDLDRFYKEFLYKQPEQKHKRYYSAGLYEPISTMFGWILSPLPLGETIKPILNDNLFDVLNNEIRMFLKKKEIYDAMRLSYKRGVLLFGEAGNGKTTFLKYLLNEQKEAISIICDKNDSNQISFLMDFLADDYYKDILKIIVIEDIDGMQQTIRSVLLNFLDGLTPTHKTIFIATTNFPERLDIAIRNRPSRFDSVHHIGLPNKDARMKLIQLYFPDIGNGQLVECANESEGFSGAYFKEIYILSKLNDVSPLTAIAEIKRRFKTFEKCGGD